MKFFTSTLFLSFVFTLFSQTPEWVADLYDEEWITERGTNLLTGWYPRDIGTQGQKLWAKEVDDGFSSPPVLCDGRLYLAGDSGTVYCFGIDGKEYWRTATGDGFEASALALSDRVIVGGMSGKIYALEKWSGKVLWTFAAEGRITAGASSMMVGDKLLVLAGTYSGYFYAIDASNGTFIWSLKAESFINGSAAVSGQKAVFGSCDGKLRLVNETGVLLWELQASSYIPESSAILEDAVYAASYEGTLYKLDLNTGKILWKVQADDEASFFTSPAVSLRYVTCAAKDDILYVYRTQGGNQVAKYELSSTLSGSPVIAGQAIIWMTANGTLSVADPSHPEEKPVTTITGTRPAGGFMISQKKIYFCTTNGEIHCWRMK